MGRKKKLSSRFIAPFEFIERIDSVTYRIALLLFLCHIHDIFHVLILKKYISDPLHIIKYESIMIDKDLSYMKDPTQIINKKEKIIIIKIISFVKVIWKYHSNR